MIKLTDTQMTVLAPACERPDGIATRPSALNRTAAEKVAVKLLELSLVQEVPAKRGAPIWRTDEQGRSYSLKILKAGRAVVRSAARDMVTVASPAASPSALGATAGEVTGAQDGKPSLGQPRAGSKRKLVIALMQRDGGATIGDLMEATGWLPHTTRAALTGLRKGGVGIVRTRDPQADASVYRIEPPAAAVAA